MNFICLFLFVFSSNNVFKVNIVVKHPFGVKRLVVETFTKRYYYIRDSLSCGSKVKINPNL